MTQPNTGFANSGDAKVAYESLGDGKAVVFNGRSLLGESSFSNHQDVIAVLDHLGIDRVVVVGCSMGGGTAFDLALAAPDRVSGLVLIGTDSPGFEAEEYEPPQWPELVKAYKTGTWPGWRSWRPRSGSSGMTGVSTLSTGRYSIWSSRSTCPSWPPRREEKRREEKRRDELTVALDPPRSGRMGEISWPVLVAVGEHDLPDVRATAAHLARTLSHHVAVVIPGAAHLANLEQPEAFNRVLTGFLEAFSV